MDHTIIHYIIEFIIALVSGLYILKLTRQSDKTDKGIEVATDAGRGQPKHWVKVYQNSRIAYFTPVAVFWGGDAVQSAVANTYLTLNSFQLVAL